MPAISIIVPIYNMEHLMRRCIDSLLAQTFTDYELLLIDDGSKDGSWSICQEYARKDARIGIFHKENGGLSDARNYGLSKAIGKYTIFPDPDDWVSPEGLDRLYATAEREQADMTICDLYREDEYSRHYVCQRPQSLQAEDVLKELFSTIHGYAWNKLIRRDVYTRFGICYPKGIYGCEDQYTMAAILLHDIKISYEPVAFYHYMYNSASLTRHYDERTYEMDMHVLEMFRTLLDGNPTQQLAVTYQENAVFTRAFWNGRDYYSSAAFQKRFAFFRNRVNSLEEMGVVKLCMAAACCGWYQLSVKFVFLLFETKQVIKRLKRLLF